ncbi:MAG: aryl-sulfate sulfotransferase [Balneola sp.]|nr:MAG: aryl-sulfate sulfotransferase [Balneola sp.]
MRQRKFSPGLLLVAIIFLVHFFLITGCNSTNTTEQSSAELISFAISEFPEISFSINNEAGIIFINAGSHPENLEELTASFITTEGASVFVNDSLQTSDVTQNDFSDGLIYTIVSEDATTLNEYFVYLTSEIPKSYLLEGEIGVSVNPTGIAPLSALASIKTKKPAQVSFRIFGELEVDQQSESYSVEQEIPIHGLYANTLNKVEIILRDQFSYQVRDTIIIQTGSIPDFFPDIEINTLERDLMEPGWHYNSMSIGNNGSFDTYPMIFDDNGDIRWYLDLSDQPGIAFGITFQPEGTFSAGMGIYIREFDLFGSMTKELSIPGYIIHHEMIKRSNGNYIVAVDKSGTTIVKNGEEITSVEDYIVEVDGSSGEIITEWDIATLLDVNRVDLVDGGGDWFHMNAIWIDEEDNSLIISGRNQGLLKVDWENNLKWILAPQKGWGVAGRSGEGSDTNPFLLDAVDASGALLSEEIQLGDEESSEFSWSWGQHAPMVLPNGNIFVFDNGFNRNFIEQGPYSQAIEYEIDEENMTAEMVWSYGRERGTETYSRIISDVDVLPNTQNRLFAPGFIQTSETSQAKQIEVSYPNGNVVFESTLYLKNLLSTSTTWGRDIIYRVERVDFPSTFSIK